MDKVACKRCGALILPDTFARTGGECMPCKKGMRSLAPLSKQSPGTPTWDLGRNDLVVADLDELDDTARVVPSAVVVEVIRTALGGHATEGPVGSERAAVSVRDLEEMFQSAGRTLVVDHRGEWAETFAEIRRSLEAIGASARMVGSASGELLVEAEGRSATVDGAASRDIVDVVAQINAALAPRAAYRPFSWSERSDTRGWTLLRCDAWSELDARHPRLMTAIFATEVDAERD